MNSHVKCEQNEDKQEEESHSLIHMKPEPPDVESGMNEECNVSESKFSIYELEDGDIKPFHQQDNCTPTTSKNGGMVPGATTDTKEHIIPACNCIVEDILQHNFSSRSYEEKKQIICSGRPKPCLVIQTKVKNYVRNFNNNMFNTVDWLTGCRKLQKLYCWPCLLFSQEKCSWNDKGINDLRNIHNGVKRHSLSRNHLRCVILQKTFTNVKVDHMVDEQGITQNIQHNEEVKKNREILKRFIDIVIFLGKQELEFKGHNESIYKGNYNELIHLISEYDGKLKHHLENSSVFKNSFSLFQNDLIVSIAEVLNLKIKKEINQTNFVAFIIDMCNLTQLSLVIRFVNEAGQVKERFIGFSDISSNSAYTLYNILVETLDKFDCANKIVAQSYDGAVVFSDHLKTLHTLVKETFPNASFMHCYAHQLNVMLSQAVSSLSECNAFFSTLSGMFLFFSRYEKKIGEQDEKIQRILKKFVLTNWNDSLCLMETLFECRSSFIALFEIIANPEKKWDQEIYNYALGFGVSLRDFTFNFLLNVFGEIFPITNKLFNTIQEKCQDVKYCKLKIMKCQDKVKGKLGEFEKIWHNTNDITDMKKPETKRKKISESYDVKTSFEHLYCEIVNIILLQIENRFCNVEELCFSQLLQSKNYRQYNKTFPEVSFRALRDSYENIFDFPSLKVQLCVVYASEEFYHRSVDEVRKFIMSNDLQQAFSEVMKLCELLLTIPNISNSKENCDSAMKRIKNYTINCRPGNKLTNLSVISIEKELLNESKMHAAFYDLVIDEFGKYDRGVQLHYK